MEPLQEVTEAEFHRQFDTNVLSAILTTQEAGQAFGPGGGSVINVSSIWSTNPVPNSVVYSASKAAIDAVTKALANELAGRKVRVNAIAPGMTETEGLAVLGIDDGTAKNSTLPMGRLGKPDDIARVAVFLDRRTHHRLRWPALAPCLRIWD
jgi:3-oxoacyl-[acyl-carrier protein] reductase